MVSKTTSSVYEAILATPEVRVSLSKEAVSALVRRAPKVVAAHADDLPWLSEADLKALSVYSAKALGSYLMNATLPAEESRALLKTERRQSVLLMAMLNRSLTDDIRLMVAPRLSLSSIDVLLRFGITLSEPVREAFIKSICAGFRGEGGPLEAWKGPVRLIEDTPSAHSEVLLACGVNTDLISTPFARAAISENSSQASLTAFVEAFASQLPCIGAAIIMEIEECESRRNWYAHSRHLARCLEREMAAILKMDGLGIVPSVVFGPIIDWILALDERICESAGKPVILRRSEYIRRFILKHSGEQGHNSPLATRAINREAEDLENLSLAATTSDPGVLSSIIAGLENDRSNGLQDQFSQAIFNSLIRNPALTAEMMGESSGLYDYFGKISAESLDERFPDGVTDEAGVKWLCLIASWGMFGPSSLESRAMMHDREYIARTAAEHAFDGHEELSALLWSGPRDLALTYPASILGERTRKPWQTQALVTVMDTVAKEFGEDSAQWEIFEALAPDFEGTIGDLIDAAKALA